MHDGGREGGFLMMLHPLIGWSALRGQLARWLAGEGDLDECEITHLCGDICQVVI